MNIIAKKKKKKNYCNYYLFRLHNHNPESSLCYRLFGCNENLGTFLTTGVYFFFLYYPLGVNNKNARIMCETCSKLTIKTPEQRQWRRQWFLVFFRCFHSWLWRSKCWRVYLLTRLALKQLLKKYKKLIKEMSFYEHFEK